MSGSDIVVLISLFFGFSATATLGYVLGAAMATAAQADERADHSDNVVYLRREDA